MQRQPKKWNTVRVVTFLEDFKSKEVKSDDGKVIKPSKTLYKNGRVTAMTLKAANKLKGRGAKLQIKDFDRVSATKRARKEFEDANKKKTELMYSQP